MHDCPWYNKQLKSIPWISCFSVLIRYQKWKNTIVLFPQYFSDRCHSFGTKSQIQITVNLFFELPVNVQSRIYHIYKSNLIYIFALILIHYHNILSMPKIQTEIFIHQIPQWKWFGIVPLLRCLNFHIIFLFFNSFFKNTGYFSM